jgi:hypothetical protein
MKVGDLVRSRSPILSRSLGMVVAEFPRPSSIGVEYNKLRVRWLDGKDKEVWLWRKDLELVNESR